MTTDLVVSARAGDAEAFRRLTDPHRRELQVHCYRMLGSLQDAEDALQETLLAAWQGLAGFEGRASVRTWLYRIATNRCLNALRTARRRPAQAWGTPGVEPPEPTRLGDVAWLEPYPDALLGGGALLGGVPLGPETRYERTESISLAFVAALQVLPPRQRAVLVLRDVLGYRAQEVADMLDATVDSVASALKRARATLRRKAPPEDAPAPAPDSPAERALVARIADAYESGHVEALVDLLTADASLTMPPIPLEYHGREAVAAFLAVVDRRRRRYDVVPTRANGQPALATYVRPPGGGRRHATGLDVFTLGGSRIRALTHFDAGVLPWFGLPRSLPG